MTLLDKLAAALEPFAAAFRSQVQDGGTYVPNNYLDIERHIASHLQVRHLASAAEALAELRAFREKPPGFEELSGMPEEARIPDPETLETAIEALKCREHTWSIRGEEAQVAFIAAARAKLEALRK